MLRITNNELLQANVRRHHRANRSRPHFGGKARVLSLEDVQQRQQKVKDEKKKAAQLKRAEQDLIKTFREICRFGPDLLGQTSTASSTKSPQKSPQKAPDSSQSKPICSFQRRLLPPLVLQPMTEEVEGVEEVKVSGGVEVEVELVEEVKKVQTTRQGRIVRQPRKM